MKRLLKLDAKIVGTTNPYLTVIPTGSPSVNWTFGKGHGLPQGYTLAVYGGPKGGKSFLVNSMIGHLHETDPDAIALRFDTEYRDEVQLTPEAIKAHKIDPMRLASFPENNPILIFDKIEKEVNALAQDPSMDGKIKLIAIDSISQIQGLKGLKAESVGQHLIGDLAQTLGNGLKRILPIIRNNRIALVLTTQVRAEMDQWEAMRNHGIKMAASFATKHFAEYFMYVEEIKSAKGKADLEGNKLLDTNLKDVFNEDGEKTGHRVRAEMVGQSMGGCRNRIAEFTIDYKRGIVNQHEEVFVLGCGRGVIERPNNKTYIYKGTQWNGKPAMLDALKNDEKLCKDIMNDIFSQDLSLSGE